MNLSDSCDLQDVYKEEKLCEPQLMNLEKIEKGLDFNVVDNSI